jgi:hypothetical protein
VTTVYAPPCRVLGEYAGLMSFAVPATGQERGSPLGGRAKGVPWKALPSMVVGSLNPPAAMRMLELVTSAELPVPLYWTTAPLP